MRSLFLLMILIGLGLLAWNIASRISPDAISMAVGMLFGVLAGIPTTMLAMANGRRRDDDDDDRSYTRAHHARYTDAELAAFGITRPPALPDSRHGLYVYRPVSEDEAEEW